MTEEEYKQLEHLLDKLQQNIRGKICIIPGYIHDGYHIGVYSSLTGKPYKTANGATIKATIELLKHDPAVEPKILK